MYMNQKKNGVRQQKHLKEFHWIKIKEQSLHTMKEQS